MARGALLLAVLAILALPYAAAQGQADREPAPIAAAVRQPRAFGYVIGDRLEQQISLRAARGYALDPKSLPRTGRTGLWLQLAPPHLTSDAAGDVTSYRLTLDYQVVNVPEQVRSIALPAVDLVFNAHGKQVTTAIDEWPITIAPITPTFVLARAGLSQIQPDVQPPAPDPAPYRWLTLLWITAIVALIAARAMRRHGIPWLNHGVRPFARAARDIAKLSRLQPDPTTYRCGLQRLHRAFDAAAGHAVFGERLASLFAARPELRDLRADIEQFYADSQREFFGVHAGSADLDSVATLARRCRDAEATASRPAIAGPERSSHAV